MLKLLIGLEHVSLFRLVLGTACGWLLTLGLPIWLAVTPTFDKEQWFIIESDIVDVAVLPIQSETVLDFSLLRQDVRFRVAASLFQAGLHGRVPRELRPGAVAKVRVSSPEYKNPYFPVPHRIPTVYVVSIEIGGVEILPLSTSRQWHEENRRYAWYLLGFTAPASVILSWGTWVKLGRGKGRLAELVA